MRNLILVGANSHLTRKIVGDFLDFNIILVGRSIPDHLLKTNKEFNFVRTDYLDSRDVVDQIDLESETVVVFIGISSDPKLLLQIQSEQLKLSVEKNIIFPLEISRNVLTSMITNRYGRFIFIGSKESSFGASGGIEYSLIKNAQSALSRGIAVEYARYNVTSNVIQLGFFEKGYTNNIPKNVREEIKKRIPTNAPLNFKSISDTIKLLIDNESISGTIIDIDQATR